VLYDNDAIYIAALLYDDEPNKIMREISDEMILSLMCLAYLLMVLMMVSKIFSFVNAADGQQITTDTNGEDYS
jgi:hypothetical protein